MQLFINQISGSVLQFILFTAIPFLWWWFTARREQRFLVWLGFKRIEGTDVWKQTFSFFFIVLVLAWMMSQVLPIAELSAASQFKSLGVTALPAAFVYAVFHTSLPEEIFFRGFLLKRLKAKFGFYTANITQAIVFGLAHGALFGLSGADALSIILVSLLPFIIALGIGWLNEKIASGSIYPGWTVHALSNIVVSFLAALS